MPDFSPAVAKLIESEGGYVDDHTDKAGETNFGITLAVARAHGYTGEMKDLPREFAEKVYKESYWDPFWLDSAATTTQEQAEQLFQAAVNMGVGTAKKLQEVARGIDPVRAAFAIAQIRHYEEIVKANPTQEKYEKGWRNRAMAYV